MTDFGSPVSKSWFALQLRPQGHSRAHENLQRQGFTTFHPELIATARAGRGKITTRKPLFPGYLFVSFDPANPGWSAINSTRGVARLVTTDPRRPTPLPPELIAGLMARCDETGLLLPPKNLKIGDRIRVLSGPFADTVATIETLPDAQRIGILMELMGRQVKTSLPRSQIQRLD